VAIETADDLAAFFEIDDFGDAATYTPLAGAAVAVSGIFDAPQASRTITDMMDITAPQPQFVCRTSDMPNAAEGDTLIVRSATYTVRAVMTDGTGVTTLMLERA
jgi:voltage-gated potassium channel Kch